MTAVRGRALIRVHPVADRLVLAVLATVPICALGARAAEPRVLPLVAKIAALQHALEHARKHVFATVAQTITAPEDIAD